MKQTKIIAAIAIMLKVTFLLVALTTQDVISSNLYASMAIASGIFTYHHLSTQQHSS